MAPNSSAHQPNIIGFWDDANAYGYCSNWHPSGFDFCGTHYATSEHWMMWQKAQVMGRLDMCDSILAAFTPRDAKALGRSVSPFDSQLWGDVCEQLTHVGVREKFMQNPDLAAELLATGSAVLAEASPYDAVWGVGLAESDPRFADISQWKGTNLQGRVCMQVRADLRVAERAGIDLTALAGCTTEIIKDLLESEIGSMSLLELSRIPATRGAVMCYARIVVARGAFASVGHFLARYGQTSLAQIEQDYCPNMGSGLPLAGWRELLAELAFKRAVGLV